MSDEDLDAILGTPSPPATSDDLYEKLVAVEVQLEMANERLTSIDRSLTGLAIALILIAMKYLGILDWLT